MTHIKLSNVVHNYDSQTSILLPDMDISEQDPLLILGKSGSGKSTLLNILGGLMRPSKGSISINGEDISSYSQAQLDDFRSRTIGIVFQNSHFIQAVSVLENVTLAQFFGGNKVDEAYATQLLTKLDLGHKLKSRTDNLSVGEKQRVAIARALANKPQIILADEPTSALDDSNCQSVVDLLTKQAQLANAKLIIVTHDSRLKDIFSNQITLS
jgi:lipoprotein-releasing system ATP-binding protein